MQFFGNSRHSCTFLPPHKSKISCFHNVFCVFFFYCTLRKSLQVLPAHIQCTQPSQNVYGEILLSVLYWKCQSIALFAVAEGWLLFDIG